MFIIAGIAKEETIINPRLTRTNAGHLTTVVHMTETFTIDSIMTGLILQQEVIFSDIFHFLNF